MAPRRPRSTSNVSASNNITRAPTASPQLKKQFALALDSIYQNNLNVIKRRDPSVVSILDQFSHVCLYNFNGHTKKWVREGIEGSIFIVEHRDAPVYGFYILNRLGTGDYSRRIYSEDDVEVLGNYLMYRYYPDFTQKRTAMNLPYPLPTQYRAVFDHEFAKDNSVPEEQIPQPEPGHPYKPKKGNSVTLGIWQFPQDGRVETIKEVMMRLHTYVKQGLPYPEQYRYGPGRPPPPPSMNGTTEALLTNGPSQEQGRVYDQETHTTTTITTNGSSEVDKLFAKLQPSPTTMAAVSAAAAPSSGSVQNWLNALTGQEVNSANVTPSPAVAHASAAAVPPSTSTRGLALLGSIFASVSQPTDAAPPQNPYPTHNQAIPQAPRLPPQPEEIQIVSPKPQSSALPQILTQNVISTLLGLGPNSASSRASSAAISSGSSHRSLNKRYDGDNESSENDGASDACLSASSTVFNTSADPAILAAGSSHLGIPPAAYPGQNGATTPGSLGIQGDVTPRAPARGIGSTSPTLMGPRSGQPQLTVSSLLSAAAAGSANVAPPPPTQHPTAANATQRAQTLVPFSADSELWPYPRAPLNDNELSSDADVVELDFSDTRALSDPSLFQEKQAGKGRPDERKKKKSRKERAAERQREREAIESGWDDPTKGQVNGVSATPPAAQQQQPLSVSALMQSVSATQQAAPNGDHATSTNGHVPHVNGTNGNVEKSASDIAREALLGALFSHPKAPPRDLTRKQFVQEVLSLIYTDNSFVDKLYEEYTSPGR